MIFCQTLQNNFLRLKIESESTEITELISNFLDFKDQDCAPRPFTITLLIKRCNQNLDNPPSFFTHEFDHSQRYHSICGQQFAAAVTDFDTSTIRAHVFNYHDNFKEQIIETILMRPLRAILAYKNLHYLHASIIADKSGNCMVISGPSGSGKTTLGLALTQAGYILVTDDDCFIEKKQEKITFYPFPTKVGIRQEVLKLFPELESRMLPGFSYGKKGRVSTNTFACYESPHNYQCRAILLPEYSADNVFQAQLLAMDQSYDYIARECLPRYPQGELADRLQSQAFFTLYGLAQASPAYRIRYNHDTLPEVLTFVSGLFRDDLRLADATK